MLKALIPLLIGINTLSAQLDTAKTTWQLGLGGNINGGNFTQYQGNARLNLVFTKGRHQWSLNPGGQYSLIQGTMGLTLREREAYLNTQYTHRWQSLRVIFYAEGEHSYLRKVDLRGQLGLGIGYKLAKTSQFEMDISEIILPEFLNSGLGEQFNTLAIRLSTRLKIAYAKGGFKLSHITLIQPAVYSLREGNTQIPIGDNFNLRSNTTLEYPLKKWLLIGLGNEVIIQTYSAAVNPAIKPIDYSFSIQIKIKG
jgi:hypothetical protein